MASKTNLTKHAAFRPFAYVIPLNGFSGAEIALVKDTKGSTFVRKAASTLHGNEALKNQVARQMALREQICEVASVPEVLDDGLIEGLYYFDMQFVPSRDANSFLIGATFDDIRRFADRITGIMRQLSYSNNKIAQKSVFEALSSKISEIDRRTDSRYESQITLLQRIFKELKKFDELSHPTYMHGDLTFENVLIDKRDQCWLIDPISSPVEHFWLDWAKIFQDCEGLWHRHRGKKHSAGVIAWFCDHWMQKAEEISPGYANHHYALLALTFARILPYAKTAEDAQFVVRRVDHFGRIALNILRDNE